MSNLKSELIETAIGILESRGTDALSLRLVARAAGVSHMAPYRHFDNKTALLAAVAETGFRDLVSAINEAVDVQVDDALRSRAIGMAYVSFARRRPALYQLMFGPQFADHEQYPGLDEAAQMAQARCVEAVRLLGPATGGSAADIRPLGIAVWSLVHGLAQLLIDDWLDLPEKRHEQEQLIEQVLDVLGRAVPTAAADSNTGD